MEAKLLWQFYFEYIKHLLNPGYPGSAGVTFTMADCPGNKIIFFP
jgi:hypothetical protein